jgi:hypothetical protein
MLRVVRQRSEHRADCGVSCYQPDSISLNFSWNEKYIKSTLYRKSKHTFYVQGLPLPHENRAVYEIMSKNMVEPEKPQTVWRMRVACWISKGARAHSHTNTLFFLLFHGNSGFANASRCSAYIACLVSLGLSDKYARAVRVWGRYGYTTAYVSVQFVRAVTRQCIETGYVCGRPEIGGSITGRFKGVGNA